MSRRQSIALRVISVLLGLLFCLAGVPKIIGGPEVADQFASWGYAAWFAKLVGVSETLAGVALLVPRAAPLGAVVVTAIMLGAAFTHVRSGEWARVPFVVALAIIAFVVFRVRSARAGVAASGGES